METSDGIIKCVRANFDGGFNCAESVLLAGVEHFGHRLSNVPRLATAFGGGLSGNGYACGALTGGLMVIGLCQGRDEASALEQKRHAYKLADQFLEAFIERFGCVNCRELTGIDFKSPQGMQRYKETVQAQVCMPIVEFAAGWLEKNMG